MAFEDEMTGEGDRRGLRLRTRRMMRSLTQAAAADTTPRPGRWIPIPDIPVSPVLSWRALAASGRGDAPVSFFDGGHTVTLTAGRMAIFQALKRGKLQAGDKVLLPAFHCPAMVDPVVALGCEPVFYCIVEDLSVDIADMNRKCAPAVRAVIAVNYFGFPNRLADIRRFCDARGLLFIEDCAHSLYGTHEGRPLGSFGDMAVASLTKFLPVREGGVLRINKTSLAEEASALRPQPLAQQLRQAYGSVELAVGHGRLSLFRPALWLADRSIGYLRGSAARAVEAAPGSVNPASLKGGIAGEFDVAWADIAASLFTRMVRRLASRNTMAVRRRRVFARYLEAFAEGRSYRPLFRALPEGVVPYMFPLIVEDLGDRFARLEDAAVPMLRFGQFPWPGIDDDLCPVSARYARCLLQLPCHQGLTDGEVAEIISKSISIIGS